MTFQSVTFPHLTRALALALSLLPGAVLAQTNDYGGYDITGALRGTEIPYGQTRGWDVRAAYDNGRFAYCVAEYAQDGYDVLVGWDNLQWQIAVPIQSRPDWEGELTIDGRGYGNGGGANMSGTSANGWTIAWPGMSEIEGFTKGSNAMLSVGKFDYPFPLHGSAAAVLKVEECVQRGGRAAAAAPSPVTPRAAVYAPVTGGAHTCSGHLFPPYACRAEKFTPEQGYVDATKIIDMDGTNPNFFVKVINETRSEVWYSLPDAPEDWKYVGFWQPEMPGSTCLLPITDGSAPSSAIVEANLGQDDWHFCVN